MSSILYYIFLKPLSLLPYRVLYIKSDILFYLLYYLIGFRKKVVMNNLRNAFPEKDEALLKKIAQGFYRHLCDIIMESIKYFSISETEAKARIKARNPELIEHFYQQGKKVILVGGHYNSWELYAIGAPFHLEHEAFALYRPLKNKFFDRKMRSTREKFGLHMIPIRKAAKPFEMDPPTATIFATDQSPTSGKNAIWTTFLNQETAVMKGAEKYAKEYDVPVIFGTMHKVKRGFYEVEYQVVCESPSEKPDGWITKTHTEFLEKEIQKAPEYWLWSHRRWKKKRRKTDDH